MDGLKTENRWMDDTAQKRIEISPAYYLGKSFSTLLRWLFLISLSFVILYPLFYMFSMSLRATADFYDITVVWVPRNFTLDHFKYVLTELGIGKPMFRTVLITVVCVAAEIFISSAVGYGFARFKFKGSNILFGIVIFTIIVPPQVLNLSNYLLVKNFDIFGIIGAITGAPSKINLLDSVWAFLLPAATGMGIRSGLLILIFRQFYGAIPVELEEASLIDGCGFLKTYFRIMVPNLSNTFLLCSVFSAVWYWTDYFYALIYLPTWKTMALQVQRIYELLYNRLGLMGDRTVYNIIPKTLAACLIFILPLLIFFLVVQKWFSQSIENTGLVG